MSAPRQRIGTALPGAAFFFLSLLVLLAIAAPASSDFASSGSSPDGDEGLRRLYAAIEAAFDRCDHAPLKGAFSKRLKTFLSSRSLGVRQGYYGADQALLLLRRGFEGRTTVRFKLTASDDDSQKDRRPAVRARWLYRDEGAPKREARLSFTLASEGGVWCIREIRELK